MFSLVSTPWHVLIAAITFVFGLVFAIKQQKTFGVPVKLAVVMYFWHSIFCVVYLLYSRENSSDSITYYLKSVLGHYELGFGTNAVILLTSVFSNTLSMSYLGVYLVFNIFGFIGVIAFASALRQVTAGAKSYVPLVSLVVLFLPGLSFWSSAIGKDALTFMGSGLVCWAILNLTRRYPALIFASVVFLLVRPHIAGILVASFGLTAVLFLKTGPAAKVVMAMMAIPLAILTVNFGLEYSGVTDPTSVESISERIETQQGRNLGGGSSVSIADMSVPVRLFSYLFRPLLFDANGLLGVVVSFENLILLFILLFTVATVKGNRTSLSRFQVAFLSVFALVTLIVLANTTANLGISIRQKWMLMPMLLTLSLSVLGRPRIRVDVDQNRWRSQSGSLSRSVRPAPTR